MGPDCYTCGGIGVVRAIATALADSDVETCPDCAGHGKPPTCATCDGEGRVLSFLHGIVRVIPCRACSTQKVAS